VPVIIILNGGIFIVLIINRVKGNIFDKMLKPTFIGIGLLAIALLPLIWALTPLIYGGDANLPYAGPDLKESRRFESDYSPHSVDQNETEKLITYLKKNRRKEKFLVAVPSSILYGSKLIIQTGEPVITLGGFNGGDETITVAQLAQMVEKGQISHFLIPKPPPEILENAESKSTSLPKAPPGAAPHLHSIFKWIIQKGASIPAEKWQSDSPLLQQFALYECQ